MVVKRIQHLNYKKKKMQRLDLENSSSLIIQSCFRSFITRKKKFGSKANFKNEIKLRINGKRIMKYIRKRIFNKIINVHLLDRARRLSLLISKYEESFDRIVWIQKLFRTKQRLRKLKKAAVNARLGFYAKKIQTLYRK